MNGLRFFPRLRMAVVPAALLALLAGCHGPAEKAASSPEKTTGESGGSTPTVAVIHPARENLARSLSLTAEFRPYQEVDIHAKVTGYVQKINVDVGDHVRAGDVLAVLEIPELQEDLRKADAAVQTAQQEAASAEAAYRETDQIDARLQAAAKEAAGLIAQQDLDTASARNQANAANLAAARQRVVEAQANADRMRTMLAYAKITAPFDGVVTRRYADTGSLIQAGTASNTQSMPLVTLAEQQRLRLDFPVPEANVAGVRAGDPVEVRVVSLGTTFPARISRFARKVDSSTRTMLTEVDVDNADFRFTPGMYATVRLTLAEKKEALSVPLQCLAPGEHPTVLVLDDRHQVEERAVTVGLETPARAEILSGLGPGDWVVVGNRSALQPGQVALAREVGQVP